MPGPPHLQGDRDMVTLYFYLGQVNMTLKVVAAAVVALRVGVVLPLALVQTLVVVIRSLRLGTFA